MSSEREPTGPVLLGERRRRVLVVDDDPDLRAALRGVLETEGFEVEEAADGPEALGALLGAVPSLLIVDQRMPGMLGSELVGVLRSHPALASLPVVLLTSEDGLDERVRGLDAGADEYIAKPFVAPELAARVRALLRRTERSLSTDSLTRLPGNLALREEIGRRLEAGRVFDLAYADLDHFKPYVDRYGFERAAIAIERTAQVLTRSLLDWGDPEDFLGHVGGDDFVLLLDRKASAGVCQAAVMRFADLSPKLYDDADRECGAIEGVDRYGTERRFPLLGLSIAILPVEPGSFADREALGRRAAHCKELVKRSGGGRWQRFPASGPLPS